MSCFFFFQAEDGIRDHCVTGVQTCALPISTTASITLFADALRPGMLLLADRGFDANKVIDAVVGVRADLLIRIKTTRITVPVRRPFPDGSYLAVVAGHLLRIVEAQVTLTTTDGRPRTETWRLATTVTDWRAAPAPGLRGCHPPTWEVGTAVRGLAKAGPGARVPSSPT